MRLHSQLCVFLLISLAFAGAVSAATNNSNNSNDSDDNIIRYLDPTELCSGYLAISYDTGTAKVGDLVNISVTATNDGLVDWCPLKIAIPIPKGLQYMYHVVPNKVVQDYNYKSGIWNVYRMKAIQRGHTKTIIITVKVLPSAAGKKISARAWFDTLELERDDKVVFKSGISMAKEMPAARTATLAVVGTPGKGNGTGSGSGSGTGSGTGSGSGSGNGSGTGSGNGSGSGNGTGLFDKLINSDKIKNVGDTPEDKLQALQSGGGGGGGKKAYELIQDQPTIKTDTNLLYTLLVILVMVILIALGYIQKMRSNRT